MGLLDRLLGASVVHRVCCVRLAAAAVFCALASVAALAANTPASNAGRGDMPSVQAQRAAVARLADARAPVYCGGHSGHFVALTFDDGPGPYTDRVLDLLGGFGAQATFFDVGRNILAWPDLERREAREGVVGDHSWSHPVLTTLAEPGLFAQMARTQRLISRLSGQPPAWLFRPPYGAFDDRVLRAARMLGMLPVLWSITADVGPQSPQAIADGVAAAVRPGSIILLHENRGQGSTASAVGSILTTLRDKGLQAVTLPQLFALDPPSPRQLRTGPYSCGPTITKLTPAEGAGGTQVTITGSGLQLPEAVYFGGQPAVFTGMSANEVHVTAPPGHGTVQVRVTTHFGSNPPAPSSSFTYR